MTPDHYADLLVRPDAYLTHADAAVRRLAVSTMRPTASVATVGTLGAVLTSDPDPLVRAEAAEALGGCGVEALDPLTAAVGDAPEVREAVATAFGEIGDTTPVPWLLETAADDATTLVREAAVAALGEIADPRAVPLLLDVVRSGPPQVRRRAVVALTVFDGADVEAALRGAASDRNPMVREAAEMVVGRTPTWERVELGDSSP